MAFHDSPDASLASRSSPSLQNNSAIVRRYGLISPHGMADLLHNFPLTSRTVNFDSARRKTALRRAFPFFFAVCSDGGGGKCRALPGKYVMKQNHKNRINIAISVSLPAASLPLRVGHLHIKITGERDKNADGQTDVRCCRTPMSK